MVTGSAGCASTKGSKVTASPSKWPKQLPPLSPEQERISNDFMRHWLEVLPNKFVPFERFSQCYPVVHSTPGFVTTLEVGAGIGDHLEYESLSPEQLRNYHAIEIRSNVAEKLRASHPEINVLVADAQQVLPFEDRFFDRILAVHVLEHLPNLPACIKELHRVCRRELLIVIPCEGGLAYSLARKISAERIYRKRYGGSYKWFYTREHINMPQEILDELKPFFRIEHSRFFPLLVPVATVNLCIGYKLTPRR
jgi:SAM-dependent methyltransferase